jgi:murein L,D-transpeptidase YafK
MLNALLACAVLVSADTQPPRPEPAIMLAGTPRAATARRAMTPLESAMSKPKMYSADSIVLDKSARKLSMYDHGQLVKSYIVALGRNPVGDKIKRGDGRTPEGLYRIEGRNSGSKYHLSLRVSYPSADDRALAMRRGVSPGGDIMLHGLPKEFATVGALHREQDWTEGCVALTNEEIEEIWRAVPDGAWIHIKP